MADLVTAVTPSAQIAAFDTLGGVDLQRSGVPRARVCFHANFASVGTGAGDTEKLAISLTLPKNYAYVCTGLNLALYAAASATANAWGDEAFVSVLQQDQNTHYDVLNASGKVNYQAGINGRIWTPGLNSILVNHVYDGVTKPPTAVNFEYLVELLNVTASIPAATFNVVAEFLQFDVSQGLKWPLWYRVPTR